MQSFTFGAPGRQYTLESGANWVQGTESDSGTENPVWGLAKAHGLKTQENDWEGSITTYDATGQVDYLDTFQESLYQFESLGAVVRQTSRRLVNVSARTGYSLIGAKPRTAHAMACEYFQIDWDTGDSPEKSSLVATASVSNFTYNPAVGGFGNTNAMSIDRRGIKTLVKAEQARLPQNQILLNATVKEIAYSTTGVDVTLEDGRVLKADYVLTTFSLGVLQADDVTFAPPLPHWKQEAIHKKTMVMLRPTTRVIPPVTAPQMGLYADSERGRYPVWQSLDDPNFFPGSGILFVTVTGDFSLRIEGLNDSQVQNEVMGVLRSMFPGVTVPDPIAFHFPRWHSDPLFRGSFSNWPPFYRAEHQLNLNATVDDRLWFAGEATSTKYFGFLHGAYFSGLEVATAMIKCIRGRGCVVPAHVADAVDPPL
ncbi:hypothetical protein NLI96_g11502 [Meripilus lineatus]|uniref:Amine oxidase domain-containing protein n=1 Tax=Meripilus lineatus TaxID=2056292 RepID=A0AAD5YD95_9APHY|nr:hypothetical protein NLI96_g11502 [Physisporinus lineatus]